MLKEMRDAAGDSGEFYTPRPVVRFMVEVMNPRLGEVILDPACGTGGFLLESFKHLEKQCKKVEDRETLQTQSIFGGEAKPLPYLLAQMNLVLHGLESPKIDPLNSLRFPLREIGDRDRVDIIMTNPPFGGEEERGILGNFPEDKQTSETALLFLQLIMRKLKRPGAPYRGREPVLSPPKEKGEGNLTGGRAAVVVPNGTLFGDGICARIKEELPRTLISTPSYACPTASSRLTRASRQICFSSIALIRQKRSGTTSSHCRKEGKTTRRLSRSSSMNSPGALSGGTSEKRTNEHGKSPHPNCSPLVATSTARIPTLPRTSNTCRPNN
jgi:hypothetical protein